MSHYETLGVETDADELEVRAAFKSLARRHHPDLGAAMSTEDRKVSDDQMRRINAAWHVLSDPDRRRHYDRSLGRVESRNFVRRIDDSPFVPYDDGTDDGTDVEAEALDDWRYETDIGDPRTSPHRGFLMIPIVLSAVSVAVGLLWMISDIQALLSVAVVCGALSLASFVATPILAMSKAVRYEGSDRGPGQQ